MTLLMLSLLANPNARTSSPSSPLGTLEPPRAHQLLERLGASSPEQDVPVPILPLPEMKSEEEEEEAAGPKSPEAKAADPRLPETVYAPKTVEELEELRLGEIETMLEWSKTPDDCQASHDVVKLTGEDCIFNNEGDFCYAKAITAYELVPHHRPEQDEESTEVVSDNHVHYHQL
eukprot:s3670_g1.t1